MGNCMERWRQDGGEERQEETEEGESERRTKGSFKDDDDDDYRDGCVGGKGGGGMKVRIVLTRHELEMFLLQLSENYEGKLMVSENVMGDLQKKMLSSSSSSSSSSLHLSSSSPSSPGWKPSLESIMECPEIQEMDRL